MAYTNELETWWAGLPGEIQSVFGFAYDKADELLKQVAGDPDDLARAGAVYANLGPQISTLGQTLKSDAASLASSWEGDAFQAFKVKIDDIEQTIKACGDATTSTDEIMRAAAEAAVDGANTIVDLVVTVIEFALGTLAIAAATAIISLGASLAAWAASEAAQAMLALSRIMQVVTKVAQVLEKVAQVLEKIAAILTKVAEIFMKMAKFVKNLKLLPKSYDAGGIGTYAGERVIKTLIGKVDNLLGVPTLPSGITKGAPKVLGDLGDLGDDVDRAESVK